MDPPCCIYHLLLGGYLAVHDQVPFEIRWEDGEGDVELVGPDIRPMHFETVGAAYQHWKRRFAPRSDAPLVVHAKTADGLGPALVRV